ncbi:MAG: ribosome silencing factor, partial [Negativicutes bacterium]|nr:ribosome silencing factor [Negativicutes bacterium]
VHVFLAERRAFYDIERLRKSARPLSPAEFDAELKAALAKKTLAARKKAPAKAKPTAKAKPVAKAKSAAPKTKAALPKAKKAVRKLPVDGKKSAVKKAPEKPTAKKTAAAK